MNYALKRFLQLIPILFGITFLSFLLMYLAGSDAVTEMYTNRGVEVAQEIIDEKKAALGLNLPFFQQYLNWLWNMLHGNMGTSYVTGEEVLSSFLRKLPATLLLTALSVLLTAAISLPCGILAAVRRDQPTDPKQYAAHRSTCIGRTLCGEHAVRARLLERDSGVAAQAATDDWRACQRHEVTSVKLGEERELRDEVGTDAHDGKGPYVRVFQNLASLGGLGIA